MAAVTTGATLLFAADVKTDYSHSVDFGNYHTYSWLKADAGNPLLGRPHQKRMSMAH
jgi:hypothetical protein